MKKLISNKSGFTLIEIVVAFAVFAIFASMILSMVRITVMQRNANAEFTKELEAQTLYLAGHYIQDTEKYSGTGIVSSGTETADGQLALDFGAPVGSYAINYGLRGANIDASYYNDPTAANLDKTTIQKTAEGLNYFVAEGVVYNDPDNTDSPTNDKTQGGQAVTSRADTRIFGNKHLDYIWIKGLKVDTTYTGPGTRLLIECAAQASSSVPAEEEPYLQYRLHFCYPYGSTAAGSYSTVDVTGADGKTYERKVYNDIPILDCGYLNIAKDSLAWDETKAISYVSGIPISGSKVNPYSIVKTSGSTVRVAIPINSGEEFGAGKSTIMYVVLDANLPATLDASYFGASYTYKDGDTTKTADNVVASGSGYQYKKYPKGDGSVDDEGNLNTWLNIYGAFPYQETEKKESDS